MRDQHAKKCSVSQSHTQCSHTTECDTVTLTVDVPFSFTDHTGPSRFTGVVWFDQYGVAHAGGVVLRLDTVEGRTDYYRFSVSWF